MKFESFSELLKVQADTFKDNTAFLYEREGKKQEMTYLELKEAVFRKVEEFEENSCHAVGILLPQGPEWIINVFAASIAGKRVVLLDPSIEKKRLQCLIRVTGIDYIEAPENLKEGLLLWDIEKTKDDCSGDILFFTSGTTSRNKAVVLTDKALCYSAWNGQQVLPCFPGDKILAAIPLSHVYGFVCTVLWPLSFGATVVFGRGLRKLTEDPKYFGVTVMSLVPSILKYLIATDSLNEELRCILIGASPCDEKTFNLIKEKGIEIRCGYGLTETASGLAMTPVSGNNPYAMEYCPDTEARIAEDGEVLIKTPSMMKGYYHDPESTKKVLFNGELKTGDIGKIDSNGMLHILGRKNEVLVMPNGEKIYCLEMESELTELLGCETAVTLDTTGKIGIFVSSEDKTEDEIWKVISSYNSRQPLGRRILKIYIVRDEFPKTATGKLQRWKLHGLFHGEN